LRSFSASYKINFFPFLQFHLILNKPQRKRNETIGSYHSGWFNTPKHEAPKLLFGKPINQKVTFPRWFHFELKTNYKQGWLEAFAQTTKRDIEETIKLPNFSYEIFEEITGITRKMMEERLRG
jgi:hypothetical protein